MYLITETKLHQFSKFVLIVYITHNDIDLRIVKEWSHQSDEHKKALRFSDVVPVKEKKYNVM